MHEKMIGNTRVILALGDITKAKADAIVNAANPSLAGGGGVDGAIHRSGGRAIFRECQQLIAEIGRLAPGKAVITTAGQLAARYVIHAVGPIWRGGRSNEARLLASAYRESLTLADKMDLHTIVFPSLATGAYGYPVREAAEVALPEVKNYLLTHDTRLEIVAFWFIARPDLDVYAEVMRNL